MTFFVWRVIFDSCVQYWHRRPPESNIYKSTKEYCFLAVAWANIALMSQTWKALRKKPLL